MPKVGSFSLSLLGEAAASGSWAPGPKGEPHRDRKLFFLGAAYCLGSQHFEGE